MASRFPNRQRAIVKAYQSLLKLSENQLPIDILSICKRCKRTAVFSYTEANRHYGIPMELMLQVSEYAYVDRRCTDVPAWVLLYNDDPFYTSASRLRFTLAHELGHIVLSHQADDVVANIEANLFAQHILCPGPVLAAVIREGNASPSFLCSVFGVSKATLDIALQPREPLDQDMHRQMEALFHLDTGQGIPRIMASYMRNAIRIYGL